MMDVDTNAKYRGSETVVGVVKSRQRSAKVLKSTRKTMARGSYAVSFL